MAPLPTSTQPPPAPRQLPAFHLEVSSLSHPGVERFFSHTSSPYRLLSDCSTIVLDLLYPQELAHVDGLSNLAQSEREVGPPPVRSVTLYLEELGGVAHTNGSRLDGEHKEYHLSSSYLSNLNPTTISREIQGVTTHELVHVFQFNGMGTCPVGVTEGIADWVRLEGGKGAAHWKEGGGERWDQGYEATAFFLRWLSTTLGLALLVPTLNHLLATRRWDDGQVMKDVLEGRDVDELWTRYKKEMSGEESTAPPAFPTHAA